MNPYTFLRRESARVHALSSQCIAALSLLTSLCSSTLQAAPSASTTLVSTYNTPSNANDVQVVGNTAYIAIGDAGLRILDASNPAELVPIGSYDTPGHAFAVQVIENRAYVSDMGGGFQILDVTDPKNPTELGSFVPETWVVDARVIGNRAYLACSEGGFQIVDITDPKNITKLGEYLHPGDPFSFFCSNFRIVGNIAYLAYGGLEIVDISDPTQPKEIGSWRTGDAADVDVVGNYAYVAAAGDGLIVFDVSNPAEPKRITRVPAPGFVVAVQVKNQIAYTSAGIYDVSNLVSPVRLVEFNYTAWTPHIQVVNDLIYFPSGSFPLYVLKVHFGTPQILQWSGFDDVISPASTPVPATVTSSSGLPVKVQIVAGSASLANGQLTITGPGKVIVKASQPGNAAYLPIEETRVINQIYAQVGLLSTFNFDTNIFGARIIGNRAYVGSDILGLQILDISNPAQPKRLGVVTDTNAAFEADVVGDHVFIANYAGGLKIANISNPANPSTLSTFSTGLVTAVTVSGSHAYITDLQARKFRIIDISNLSEPKQVAEIEAKGEPRYTLIQGTRAYLACGTGGLVIYDVANPADPKLISTVYKGSQVRGVAVVGDTVYVPDYGFSQFLVFNISDLANPVELGRLKVGGYPRRLRVEGNLAFLTSEANGLLVIDVSDPAHMTVISQYDLEIARDIEKVGNILYIADQNKGLRVLELKETGFRPNISFAPATTISYGNTQPLTGTSSSGQPVQFSVVSGPGRIENGQLIPTGLGLIQVRAAVASKDAFMSGTRDITVQSTIPALSYHRNAGSLNVSWPTGLTHATVEQSDSIAANAVWKTLSTPVTVANGIAQTTVALQDKAGFIRLNHPYPGISEPLSLTGWNRDVVLENTTQPVAQEFGLGYGTWYEDGLDGYFDGLPSNGKIVDAKEIYVSFQLQPYTANNVLQLDDDNSKGTLTLTQPGAYSKIHILAAAPWQRPTSGTVVIKYVDGTVSQPQSFEARNWSGINFLGEYVPGFSNPVGRSKTFDTFNYSRGENGYNLYQTVLDLGSAAQSGKAIASLEFTRVDEPGYIVGIFAVSGTLIPTAP